jgi:hypothetical protein
MLGLFASAIAPGTHGTNLLANQDVPLAGAQKLFTYIVTAS